VPGVRPIVRPRKPGRAHRGPHAAQADFAQSLHLLPSGRDLTLQREGLHATRYLYSRSASCAFGQSASAPGRERPRHRRTAEQSDELAASELIEGHSVPPKKGRIAGYRIGWVQSGGIGAILQPAFSPTSKSGSAGSKMIVTIQRPVSGAPKADANSSSCCASVSTSQRDRCGR
jgi:hypothetical protein